MESCPEEVGGHLHPGEMKGWETLRFSDGSERLSLKESQGADDASLAGIARWVFHWTQMEEDVPRGFTLGITDTVPTAC